MKTPDLNPKPEALAFSAQHLAGKGKTERCSHCKREGHNQERCWILHPHLRSKRTDRNQSEVAKKKVFAKTLEKRKGFVAAREEPSEGERKGFNEMNSHSSSQTDSDRLNQLESMLATLLNHRTNTQSGTIYCHNKTEKLVDKLIHNPTNCTKNSGYFNKCLTIGPSTINVLPNCTQWYWIRVLRTI
jgi:hypothetical protein